MKKLFITLFVVGLIFGVNGMAQAYSWTITDEYWGADDQDRGDVIGSETVFGIDSMDVEIVGNTMTVKVNTVFDAYSFDSDTYIDFGDLFISTDGWNPYGDAPYEDDNALADGEDWEYVFDVSAGAVYNITNDQDNIVLNDNLTGVMDLDGLTYREGQEVLIDLEGLSAIGTGTADKSDLGGGVEYYEMSFDISNLTIQPGMDIGLHWAMTCANDAIEGGFEVPIPEPSTLLLVGAGLLGLVAFGRKRGKK